MKQGRNKTYPPSGTAWTVLALGFTNYVLIGVRVILMIWVIAFLAVWVAENMKANREQDS